MSYQALLPCRLAPKLLQYHSDTRYIQNQKCHTLRIFTRTFSALLRIVSVLWKKECIDSLETSTTFELKIAIDFEITNLYVSFVKQTNFSTIFRTRNLKQLAFRACVFCVLLTQSSPNLRCIIVLLRMNDSITLPQFHQSKNTPSFFPAVFSILNL